MKLYINSYRRASNFRTKQSGERETPLECKGLTNKKPEEQRIEKK